MAGALTPEPDSDLAVTVTFQNGSGPTPVGSVLSVSDTAIMLSESAKLNGKKGVIAWDDVVGNSNGSDVVTGGFTVTR